MALCKLRSRLKGWLLATVSVSARTSAHAKQGGTLSAKPRSITKYSFEVYVQKERDKKPDIQKIRLYGNLL